MNKKSNVIIGAALVGVIGLGVLGMSVFGKTGKGGEPQQAAFMPQAKEAVKQGTVQSGSSSASVGQGSGSFVASKQGKKYFPVDCGTAKSIKEENKVFFGSESEAEAAGYERSLTCK